jgi:bacteriocin biosynthesis cyclodehydratase domain-containing protein
MTISLRPRPHHPVLRRSAEAVQFGIGPGGSVEVCGGDPQLRRMLLDWHGDQPVDELVRRAVEAGVAEPTVRSVLDELCRAGALVDSARADRVLAERSAATVLVTGDGPLLPGLTSALAASGVGRLAVAASGIVLAEDVGGYDHADRGHPRAAAAVRAVHRVAPDAHCTPRPPRGRVDLVVLTDRLHPGHRPPATPHLLVRLVDGLGLVGPLVLPGRTACLRCFDLHLAAGDPCWPTVAADLVGRVGSAGPATVAATAALAAEQALTALDALVTAGPPPPTLDGVLELDTRRGSLRRRHWPPHPSCSCGAGHRGLAGLSRRGSCGEPNDSRESPL